MNINEHDTQPYDWANEGVYQIEAVDPVEGGPDGVSNRQAVALTKRTRNLHARMTTAEGEIDTLQEQTPLQVEAALRSANTYTDGKDTVLRADMAIADTAAINTAKSYADQVVAALVDNSPAALNTLQELAKALDNDPNFATTVMAEIGRRMKTTDVNAALDGKANTGHGHSDLATNTSVDSKLAGKANNSGGDWLDFEVRSLELVFGGAIKDPTYGGDLLKHSWKPDFNYFQLGTTGASAQIFLIGTSIGALTWNGQNIYHSGNLIPATTAANGLMSAADKTKLDAQPAKIIRGSVNAAGRHVGGSGFDAAPVGDKVRVTHELNTLSYSVVATVNANGDNTVKDNAITVWSKNASYVDFFITNGTSPDHEPAAFDFMIMPY